MRSIFGYLDYRDALRDAFEERKERAPEYTYRVFAEALGMHASNMHRLLHKKTHLPARCQSRAIELLELKDRPAAYFLLLVAYARERGSQARHELLEKAMALRDVSRFELGEKELAYFQDWSIAAVRGALEILDGRTNPVEIAAKLDPPVTEARAREAVELLHGLGLVRRVDSGRLKVSEPHLGVAPSEERVQVVRRYQRSLLGLAAESIERFPPEQRDVTSLSMVVDREAFLRIREILRECRQSIRKSSDASGSPDRVMQLVMAFYPLTRIEEGA